MSSQEFLYTYSGEVDKYLSSVSELMRKLINRGLLMLQDLPTASGINEDTSAVVLLFRHALALIDGLAELSRMPSVETLNILSRSFLETKCSLEFILEEDTPARAAAYQTQHLLNRIRQYEQYDSRTELGKRFQEHLNVDRLFGPLKLSELDTRSAIQNLQKQLEREPYKSAAQQLSRNKKMKWYAIDDGPKNMRELCDHLHYPIAYDYLYTQLSQSVHATAAYTNTFFGKEGRGQMHALRAMSGYQDLMNILLPLAVDFFMETSRRILPKHYERFARFYKNIYKPFRDANVSNVKIEPLSI